MVTHVERTRTDCAGRHPPRLLPTERRWLRFASAERLGERAALTVQMDELHNDPARQRGLTHRPEAEAFVRRIRRGACADIKRGLDATLGRGLANRHQQGELPRPLTGALIVLSESLAFPNLEGAGAPRVRPAPCSLRVSHRRQPASPVFATCEADDDGDLNAVVTVGPGGPALAVARVLRPGAPDPSCAPLSRCETSLGRNLNPPARRHLRGRP
jgi:hypothetical protein